MIYAIPDIHGRMDLLQKLLETMRDLGISPARGDKFIFLGDMIDRGPDSYDVLLTIKELSEEFPGNVIALRGNHENLMLDVLKAPTDIEAYRLWLWNGGGATEQSFERAGFPRIPLEFEIWVMSLPLFHVEPGFHFSHAPLPRESHRNIMRRGQPYNEEDYTWTYGADEFGVAKRFEDGTIGVCGHMHALQKGVFEPRFYDHYIFADAGCGCHKRAPLVAINCETRDVIYARPE